MNSIPITIKVPRKLTVPAEAGIAEFHIGKTVELCYAMEKKRLVGKPKRWWELWELRIAEVKEQLATPNGYELKCIGEPVRQLSVFNETGYNKWKERNQREAV